MTIDEMDEAIKRVATGELTYRDRQIFLAGIKFATDSIVSDADYRAALAAAEPTRFQR